MGLQKGSLVLGNMTLRDATQEELTMIESGQVSALKFDTMEELEEYIDMRKPTTIDITSNIYEIPSIKPFGLSDVGSRTIGVDPIPLPPVYINCQFNYTSKKDSSGKWAFTGVSDIKSWLTGIQFPVNYSWEQKSATPKYSNEKRNVKITVSGVLGTHIIVKGVGKILDQNMSYAFDFTARK